MGALAFWLGPMSLRGNQPTSTNVNSGSVFQRDWNAYSLTKGTSTNSLPAKFIVSIASYASIAIGQQRTTKKASPSVREKKAIRSPR